MLDELSDVGAPRRGALVRAVVALIKRGARALLDFEPVGSLLVEFPTGESIRLGRAPADGEPLLRLNNYRVLAKAFRRGSLGFAEAYIDGDVDCSDLTGLFRFYQQNEEKFIRAGGRVFRIRLPDRLAHRLRRNSRRGSRRNIAEHYDLGNAFFAAWLDTEMHYSSGIYSNGRCSLDDAQHTKVEHILALLDLSRSEEVLEIGCGWGAFARRAARDGGARVTGITLSAEQLAHSREAARRADLSEQCRFFLQDYRDHEGTYDRIVAIEMIEAVGEGYWPDFFRVLHDRLRPGGTAVLQAITIDESRFAAYRRRADFIQRYVFPGGMLLTPAVIECHSAAAGLRLDHVQRFGESYALTLRDWRRRFEAAWPQIAALGFDERFRRCWRYYLDYCEAGFLEGVIDVGLYRLQKA